MKKREAFYIDVIGILGAVIAAVFIGFLIILLLSDEPYTAISSLLFQPFANPFNIGTVLNKAVPLIFTGLSVAIVFRAGIFSIGAEGQLYMGAFFGALVATYISGLSPWFHLPLTLIAAMIGGALFAAIPGWLKGYLNVDEIVTTLMLNYVSILTVSYFLNNVFKDPGSGGYARMPFVQPSAKLNRFIEGFPTHTGIFIALLAVVAVYLYMYKTRGGYEIRLVGQNKLFTEYGGMKPKNIIVKSVVLSGVVAGLAGIVEVIGLHGTLKDSFSVGLGFDGIIIALLARNHPIGVLVASLFYAYLQVGAQLMQANSDVPRELAIIIQVLLVLLVSARAVFTYLKQRKLKSDANLSIQGGVNDASNSAGTNS